MKRFLIESARAAILLMAVFGVCMSFQGCKTLTPEQQEKLQKLEADNAKVIDAIATITNKARASGDVNLLTVAELLKPLQERFEANTAVIKELKASGLGTWETIGLVFHRTILHAVQAAVPQTGGPIALGINWLLTLILGGSNTKKLPVVSSATSSSTG